MHLPACPDPRRAVSRRAPRRLLLTGAHCCVRRLCPVEGRPLEQLVTLPLGEDHVNVCKGLTPFPRSTDMETEVKGGMGRSPMGLATYSSVRAERGPGAANQRAGIWLWHVYHERLYVTVSVDVLE
jgi:hypothetical protein